MLINMDQFFATSYRVLSEFPLTRDYVEKIGYRYRFISPCDSSQIARKTVIACISSWTVCIIIFCFIYLTNRTLNTLIIASIGIMIADSVVIGTMAKLFEITVLLEIEKLFANVVHHYYVEYRVDDALYRSMEFSHKDMKMAALQIYELLLSDDKEVALRDYYENVPNKYLRAFVGRCMSVMERGDEEINGKFLFVSNIECLQREIDIEVEKLNRLNMEFAGVLIAVVAPIFFLDFIKQFAINMKETMQPFYYGKVGFLCDMGYLSVTLFVYTIMRKSGEFRTFHQSSYWLLYKFDKIPFVKKCLNNYSDKNASIMERRKRELRDSGNNISPRHFVLRSFLISILVFILGTGIIAYLHIQTRQQLMKVQSSEMENLTSAAKEEQYENMGQVVVTYTKKYTQVEKGRDIVKVPDSQEEMAAILQEEGTFYNSLINEALAKEILKRVGSYKTEYFSFIDLCLCFVISIFMYHLPLILMKYNSTVSKDAMEDEVNQFNAIISMLMRIDGMSVKQLLEEMESFAVVFKQSIRICINDYSSGDIEALEALMEREPYEPFVRIVENLMRCDDMSMEQAFHEIDTNRDGYISKRKLTNEKSIKRRVRRAFLLAAIPLFLLIAYGVAPPLVSSMNEINAMMNELNSSW